MWMKILNAFLLGIFLTISAVASAPESDAAIYVVPLVEETEAQTVDPKELKCLQKNIYFEARNQGREGMRAVAAVTVNRTLDPRFPNTVCRVVYQRKQFSWANNGDREPYLRNAQELSAWTIAGEIAHKALTGTLQHDVGESQYFHVTSMSKPRSWPPMQLVTTVKDHVFYHQPL